MLSLLFSCVLHGRDVKGLFQKNFKLQHVEVILGRKAIDIFSFMKYDFIFRFLLSPPFSFMDHRSPLKVNSPDLWKYLTWSFTVWHTTSKPEQNQFRVSLTIVEFTVLPSCQANNEPKACDQLVCDRGPCQHQALSSQPAE